MGVIWFLVGIPIAVEVIAALLRFRDCIRTSGLRVYAIEGLIFPLFALGVLLWLASPVHWIAIAGAFAVVLAWQVLVHVSLQVALRRNSFHSRVIDTDQSLQ